MVFWKSSTSEVTHTTPFKPTSMTSTTTTANAEESTVYRLTALEIVVLVITFLAFVGQFINLGYALADHGNLQRLREEVRRGFKPS